MSGCNHLYRRGAAYWFRRRVPEDLKAILGRAEWKESLGTKDPEEAKRRCRKRAVESDQDIFTARAQKAETVFEPLTPQEAQALANQQLSEWLENDQEARFASGARAYENAEVSLDVLAADAREALAMTDWTKEIATSETALKSIGRWYPRSDPSFRLLAVAMLRARVRLVEALEQRQRGLVVDAPVVAPVAAGRPAGRTVGQLIEAFRAERERTKGAESTERKYRHIWRALEEGLGQDKPLRSITRADCRELRALLANMPVHMSKRYPGLTIEQATAAAARDGNEAISERTLWSYLVNLKAVFNWAVKEEWMDKNPAQDLAEKGRAKVRRRGFAPAELETLFSSLQAERTDHPWRYWLPALSLYSGARAGELAQLLVGDIKPVEGRWCFDLTEFGADGVRDAGKRLKTAASERIIPIHPAVIRAGFLRFVRSRGAATARLFPELKEGPNGGYSHDLSRWFGRHLGKIGLDDPSLVFHSFRHGFRDAGARARIQDATIDALGGWKTPGIGAGYGNRRALIGLMAGELRRIRFGDFRLPSGQRRN